MNLGDTVKVDKIIQLFDKFQYKYDMYHVFKDFCEMSAISISNAVDKRYYPEREKRYFQIIKQYKPEDLNIFANILAEVVLALDEEMDDVLGRVFMEMNLKSKWKGQYFTPVSIGELISVTMVDQIIETIDRKGEFTVYDPAVGGGALIIAMAKVLHERGINYQRYMKVTAVDIDIKAIYMCYVQLSLLGIDAVLWRGDSLKQEYDHEPWRTPQHILRIFGLPKEGEKPIEAEKPDIDIGQQLSIFDLMKGE